MGKEEGGQSERLRVLKHNLKGPLTIVKGYLSFWKADDYQKFPPEKQKEFIVRALEKSTELERMIDETFDTIRKEYKRVDE